MPFSCFGKKRAKRSRHRRGLFTKPGFSGAIAPGNRLIQFAARRTAPSYVPPLLNRKKFCLNNITRKCPDFRSAAMCFLASLSGDAPREILKRAHLARGSASPAPLKLTSLVTFLFSHKKVTRTHSCINCNLHLTAQRLPTIMTNRKREGGPHAEAY